MSPSRPFEFSLALALVTLGSCSQLPEDFGPQATFSQESGRLHSDAEGLLLDSGTGSLVLSPLLQGRVMTSTVAAERPGQGFVNHASVLGWKAGTLDPAAPFQNHGGEDRIWIGPEAGPYALFFDAGAPQEADSWRVPRDLDHGAFEVVSTTPRRVVMERTMELENILGTSFVLGVQRTIEVPQTQEVLDLAGGLLPTDTQWVAYRSVNEVRNEGEYGWFRNTGVPCVWILGMFKASPTAWVIAPFRGKSEGEPGDPGFPAESAYLGDIPSSRLRRGSNFVLFRADAEYRSKIGFYRRRAHDVMGAYDSATGVLTLVKFGPVDRRAAYLSELWIADNPQPYEGDVSNSYNHGGPEPFFEIESSSPALELAPGESYAHSHMTVHLYLPDPRYLARAARTALGVDWQEVSELAGW